MTYGSFSCRLRHLIAFPPFRCPPLLFVGPWECPRLVAITSMALRCRGRSLEYKNDIAQPLESGDEGSWALLLCADLLRRCLTVWRHPRSAFRTHVVSSASRSSPRVASSRSVASADESAARRPATRQPTTPTTPTTRPGSGQRQTSHRQHPQNHPPPRRGIDEATFRRNGRRRLLLSTSACHKIIQSSTNHPIETNVVGVTNIRRLCPTRPSILG